MNLPVMQRREERKGYAPRNPRRVALALARYRARRMQPGDQRYVEYSALAYIRSERRRLDAFYAWVESL